MKYVELVDPYETLAPAEQRALDAAFERRGDEFILRHGVSRRAVARALPIIEKYRRMIRLKLPTPPQPTDWRVWRHKRSGLSYDALGADNSPVLTELRRTRRSTPESRHQLALRAVRRVDRFRRVCDERGCPWWFRAIERTVTD